MRGALIFLLACGGSTSAVVAPKPPPGATTKVEAKPQQPIDPIAALATPPDDRSWIVPGLAQLELGGPSFQAPTGADELEVTLLEEQATMVRVAVRLEHLGFALWTERARLLGIAARDQIVSSHPGGDFVDYRGDPISAQLHTGARVRVLGHRDKWAQVRYLGALEIDGWVPDTTLLWKSARDSSYRGRVPTGRTTLMVLPGAVIRTEAQWSARELAVMANGPFLDTIKEIDEAWAEVLYEDGDVRVHGFVSKHDPPGRVHRPHEPEVAPTPVAPNTLIAAGSCLYAGDRGEAIGFVTSDVQGELAPSRAAGWFEVGFDTPWGPITFAMQGPTDHELVKCQPTAP